MTTEAPDLLDLLTAVADNPHPLADRDKQRIRAAFIAAAEISDDKRTIDPNVVRDLLSNEHGLTVDNNRLSASYGSYRAKGLIQRTGWVESTDRRGKNAGKLIHLWRWVGGAA
jgi:hypothetical protein